MTSNSPGMSGFGMDSLKRMPPVAIVGAIGSGDNDVKMLQKAKVAFSTSQQCHEHARDAADMILMKDSLEDVVMAVTKGRCYKDHLMKFILLQMPASITGVGMVLAQVFLYNDLLVTGTFVFLVNLVYFPIGISLIIRENATSRHEDMVERWRSVNFPGAKTITGYMKAEYLKFSIAIVTIFQVGAMAALYYYAD